MICPPKKKIQSKTQNTVTKSFTVNFQFSKIKKKKESRILWNCNQHLKMRSNPADSPLPTHVENLCQI